MFRFLLPPDRAPRTACGLSRQSPAQHALIIPYIYPLMRLSPAARAGSRTPTLCQLANGSLDGLVLEPFDAAGG